MALLPDPTTAASEPSSVKNRVRHKKQAQLQNSQQNRFKRGQAHEGGRGVQGVQGGPVQDSGQKNVEKARMRGGWQGVQGVQVWGVQGVPKTRKNQKNAPELHLCSKPNGSGYPLSVPAVAHPP